MEMEAPMIARRNRHRQPENRGGGTRNAGKVLVAEQYKARQRSKELTEGGISEGVQSWTLPNITKAGMMAFNDLSNSCTVKHIPVKNTSFNLPRDS